MELGKQIKMHRQEAHLSQEELQMRISYNKLQKLMIDNQMKRQDLMRAAEISSSVATKLNKNETHQDVGQMDMYIRMYDELKRSEGDNPTIGIVLCSDTDDDIARYSVMHGNEQLFASKYKLYLPTKEELKAEIETQKAMFYLQQQDNEDRNKNYTFNIE